jgi:hypothetical protein
MNGRNIVLAAVALGLVALIIVFFASAGDTGGDVAPHTTPVVAGGDEGSATAPPTEGAPGEAPPVSRSAARAQKAGATPADAESKLELPPDAKPSDGGLAFGGAVCEKMATCDCQERAVESCARAWVSIQPEEWDTVKCMLDLPCQDICRLSEHPKDVACLVAVDEMLTKRISGRKIE